MIVNCLSWVRSPRPIILSVLVPMELQASARCHTERWHKLLLTLDLLLIGPMEIPDPIPLRLCLPVIIH